MAWAAEPYHLEVVREVNTVLTLEQTLTLAAGDVRQLDLYMAQPPSLPLAQANVARRWWLNTTAIDPQRAACADPVDQPFGSTILTYRLPYALREKPATIKVTTFARLLNTRVAVGGPKPEQTTAITPGERDMALAETPALDFSRPEFQAWYRANGLHQRPAEETDRTYVARAGLAMAKQFRAAHTDAGADGWRASAVVTRRQLDNQPIALDCVPTSVLLAAIMRAPKESGAAIPAILCSGWLVDQRITKTPVGHTLVRYWDSTAQAWLWADMTGALRPVGDTTRPEPTLEAVYALINQRKDVLIEEFGGGIRPEPGQPVYDAIGPLTYTYRWRGNPPTLSAVRSVSYTELP